MKYSLYLISALLFISCVSAHNQYHRHPHSHNSKPALNDLQNDLLNFGINFIFQKAADKYGVADSDVQVTTINNFGTRVWNNDWTVYWFNVDATNNNDATVEARFGVEYNHETGERNMGKWKYHIHYYDNNDNGNAGVNANEENEVEGVLVLNEENSLGENELGFDEGGANLEAESEFEVEIEVQVEGESTDNSNTDYEDVPQDEIQSDPVINAALLVGADFIFADAAVNFGLSENGIQIADVERLERRNAGDSHVHYRAHVQAENDDGALVDARFIVDVDNQTQDMRVIGLWSYNILNYGNQNEEAGSLEEESILESALDFTSAL